MAERFTVPSRDRMEWLAVRDRQLAMHMDTSPVHSLE